MLPHPLLLALLASTVALAAFGLESPVEWAPDLKWEDPDCLDESDDFRDFLGVFGDEAELHSEDSLDWMILSGFGPMVGKPDRRDRWPTLKPSLQKIERRLEVGLTSSCLGVRAFARAATQLLAGQDNGAAFLGSLPLVAASRFPTFRLLCAASEPKDGLAEAFFAPSALRSDQWIEALWSKSDQALQAAQFVSGGTGSVPPGLVGSRWTLHLMLCLMGLRTGAEGSIRGIEDVLRQHGLSQFLNSSLFCLLHGLKLYRLRPLRPRRTPQTFEKSHFLRISENAAEASRVSNDARHWRGRNVLFVTAAWGPAAPTTRRWVRNVVNLGLPSILYCLDEASLNHCRGELQKLGGQSSTVVECLAGPHHGDLHGADKYELILALLKAAPNDDFTVVWTDLDGVFLKPPAPDAFDDVNSLGLVRHARSACLNGGVVVAKKPAIETLEHIVHWIHHFPFGYEQNALNAIAREVEGAPFLKAPKISPKRLSERLFVTGIDAIGGNADAVWVHLWTPPSYSLDSFLEEVADRGQLETFIAELHRKPRPEHQLLECVLAQVALRAPMLLHFSPEAYNESWLKEETIEESEFQRLLFTVVGRAYLEGRIVQKDAKKALQMYRRAAALGGMEANEALQNLDPRKQIANLIGD